MSRSSIKQSKMGAVVQYCGHNGVFMADLFVVAGACAVKANGLVSGSNICRDGSLGEPTHHLCDFPLAGLWDPKRGIFVVPAEQVLVLGS